MKARHWTLILLSVLIAFAAASWGRVAEWWADMSPGWKAIAFVIIWGLLILIGLRNGQYYALAAVCAGSAFIAIQVAIAIHKYSQTDK